MILDNKIRDKKLHYNTNKEAIKISALSSDKIDKYECVTDEKMLLSNQIQVIEQAKVYMFSYRKSFLKTKENH